MANEMNFTKGAIERIPTPEKRTKYRDHGGPQSTKGLYLNVGTSLAVRFFITARNSTGGLLM